LLALDRALDKLSARDPLLGKIVVMRFFGGLSIAETAEALSRSTRSVERDWTRARTYLYRDLEAGDDSRQ
jgi:DNA-directed RNA polymerase specialized sigma24 family protein